MTARREFLSGQVIFRRGCQFKHRKASRGTEASPSTKCRGVKTGNSSESTSATKSTIKPRRDFSRSCPTPARHSKSLSFGERNFPPLKYADYAGISWEQVRKSKAQKGNKGNGESWTSEKTRAHPTSGRESMSERPGLFIPHIILGFREIRGSLSISRSTAGPIPRIRISLSPGPPPRRGCRPPLSLFAMGGNVLRSKLQSLHDF